MKSNLNWNATNFFRDLTARNKFATAQGFAFARVSGLEGFEEALQTMQSTTAFVCVSDMSQGYIALANTPRTRRVKTIFLAMRHAIDGKAQLHGKTPRVIPPIHEPTHS